jgi:hypothetical protein
MREWKHGHGIEEYIYHNEDGRIIGETGRVGMNGYKYYATVYSITTNEMKSLGHYISGDHSKKAIEKFWDIQDRILIENAHTE